MEEKTVQRLSIPKEPCAKVSNAGQKDQESHLLFAGLNLAEMAKAMKDVASASLQPGHKSHAPTGCGTFVRSSSPGNAGRRLRRTQPRRNGSGPEGA